MTRILIIKLSSLGDLFHALPAVHGLKNGLNAPIDWITQPEYAGVVGCFKDVDRVLVFPRRNFVVNARRFMADLRQHEYSHIIDLQGLLKSAIVARLARGALRIGPSFHREGSRFFYNAVTGPLNRPRHAVDEIMDVVRYLGLPILEPVFPVAFPKRNMPGSSPRVGVSFQSRWITKNWPIDSFIELIRALRDQTHASVFLVGGPDEIPGASRIEKAVGADVFNWCGKTSLLELGTLLQEMDLMISVDSGPMHMAAALGKPVLAIMGATDPRRTGPYGSNHRVVHAEGLDCWPCHTDWCKRGDLACLSLVQPEQVLAAALEMLK